ncbi:phosphatidylinositol 4-kinase alpha [Oceanobacillus picturae]|uniref:Phosphatidylinositol 4-kinase alpha n=1 Tax=Oceanobacillus picturae TaxID=171693 RepID=A0A0U9HA35_9BACI|nr:phosphatidylinositol 4-kinase alpha [Oceanobacillus picturae]
MPRKQFGGMINYIGRCKPIIRFAVGVYVLSADGKRVDSYVLCCQVKFKIRLNKNDPQNQLLWVETGALNFWEN